MITNTLDLIKIELQQIVSDLNIESDLEIDFEVPKEKKFGDYSTNIAMKLAKELKKNPRIIAEEIIKKIDCEKLNLDKCEVAGAGFINFFINRQYLSNVVFEILEQEKQYGSSNIGEGTKINIEFVSANPTGYLHIGHGRGAAYGDSLARIYRKLGYEVATEHYVNDAGNQIHNLTLSIYERYKQLFGLDYYLGEDSYHGKEIIEIAEMIKEEHGDKYLREDYYSYFRKTGLETLLKGLKNDLKDFRVEFDCWFSEQSLYDNGEVQRTLDFLIGNDFTYEKDGALWLKTSQYGDDKDRVLIKSDGSYTYLAPDISYHMNKLSRGFDYLIDVLGTDHHGYIGRLKAAVNMVGGDANLIDIEILQMVRVIQDGQELKMSKRSGKAITLRDLIDEVGTDALRFLYVSKSLSTHMDLDLDMAIKNSNDNPVYYVQYAYARIASVFRNFKEQGHEYKRVESFEKFDYAKHDSLLLTLVQYPSVIEEAAIKRQPHRVAQYTLDLASELHSFYSIEKIITDDILETNEKLTVLEAVQIVLKDSLNLLGVNVREKM